MFDTCPYREIPIFFIAGIACKQITGDPGALPAMDKTLLLAAGGNGTFPMERVAICGDTSSASVGLLPGTAGAVQAAPGINDFGKCKCISHIFLLMDVITLGISTSYFMVLPVIPGLAVSSTKFMAPVNFVCRAQDSGS